MFSALTPRREAETDEEKKMSEAGVPIEFRTTKVLYDAAPLLFVDHVVPHSFDKNGFSDVIHNMKN